MADASLLEVEDLYLHYRVEGGAARALDGVSLRLGRGEALAVLGESGCGKSSLARALLRVLPRNVARFSGRVRLDGEDLMPLGEERFRREVRWQRIALVLQTALNALNPVIRVGEQVAEPLRLHRRLPAREARARAGAALRRVGVPEDFLARYPFELSGGMRQRVVLAMALVTRPDLVILDEPTSALDVLTQAAIMNRLKAIKRELGTSFILITHDVGTASELADRVALMYAGRIMEHSAAEHFFRTPAHPYARLLLDSVPRLHQDTAPVHIPGEPPGSGGEATTGCRFAPRCPQRFARCDEEPPALPLAPGRRVRCWLAETGGGG